MGIILCNGYVTGSHISKTKALTIKCFLCDGYVIGFQKGVCNGYVTGSLVSKLKALIINKFLCNGYVTEHLIFDGYLTGVPEINPANYPNPYVASVSLFDGYLTGNLKTN